MKRILLLIALCGILTTANTQSFQLVKNLYDQTESLLYDYDAGMTYFNGKLYFTSYYGDIVVSDGTSSGTQIVSKLGMQKMTVLSFHKNRFVPMGNKLYYKNRRNELCVTDGTTNGTYVVADIHPTDSTNQYGVATIMGATSDKLFFAGNDGVNGFELWVSDGTANGTRMIKDFAPGLVGFFNTTSKHHIGTILDDKLYFFANDRTNGWEPWVSDGTEAGTFMLINSNPTGHCSDLMATTYGGYGASEMKFFSYKNAVYFIAYRGIYKTDGTIAGTTLELSGANYGANIMSSMCVFDNHLYFNYLSGGNRQLTKSDGTAAGTVVVGTMSGSMVSGFQEFNGELYFRCKKGSSSYNDYIAKLAGSKIDSLTRTTSGFFNYSVEIVQPIGNDFLYMGDYYNHAIYRYNNGANTLANPEFTSTYDNLLSTPIGTFAIGTNSTYGYELWKWSDTASEINELNENSDVKIFPNPVRNIMNIELSSDANMKILNSVGATVFTRKLNSGNNSIDVSYLTNGVYYLTDNKGSVWKIIKN